MQCSVLAAHAVLPTRPIVRDNPSSDTPSTDAVAATSLDARLGLLRITYHHLVRLECPDLDAHSSQMMPRAIIPPAKLMAEMAAHSRHRATHETVSGRKLGGLGACGCGVCCDKCEIGIVADGGNKGIAGCSCGATGGGSGDGAGNGGASGSGIDGTGGGDHSDAGSGETGGGGICGGGGGDVHAPTRSSISGTPPIPSLPTYSVAGFVRFSPKIRRS